VLQNLSQEWRKALLTRSPDPQSAGEIAYAYLKDTRGIHEQVIAKAMIGMVPSGYDVALACSPWIAQLEAAALKAAATPKRGRPKRGTVSPQERLEWATGVRQKLVECCHKLPGWLAFFYTDAHFHIVQIRFRHPRDKLFASFKPGKAAGLFGRELFSPYEIEAYLPYNQKLLITEGEFNALQLQSLALRIGGIYVNAAAVGSANGVDYATIVKVAAKPVFIYDNDQGGAGKKLITEAAPHMRTEVCTTPDPDSDLDSYIRSFKDDTKAAWQAVQQVIASREVQEKAWETQLLLTAEGNPTECMSNIILILEHHAEWEGAFWFDSVRMLPMMRHEPVGEAGLAAICRWLGVEMRMSVRSPRLVERCLQAVCQQTPRDLLREWLEGLPAWDETERLSEWLSDYAGIERDAYVMDISRLMVVSMVARALDPGCQFREVIILEGAENIGKSKLVRTLATPEWYVELTKGLDNKEAHMMLQGSWVAEFSELDSLSRTEETKLKAFITTQEDVWVPKFSNFKTRSKRRTVFIGTTNEETYLKGQSGNTRYLPLTVRGPIRIDLLEAAREQLFAEALVHYQGHPDTWWQLSAEAEQQAGKQREQRRQASVYEDPLAAWLDGHRPGPLDQTSWPEIAEHFLKRPDPADWKDKGLQQQIAQALTALGWVRAREWDDGKDKRIWVRPSKSAA
jgi:predicted P-loop ATPase